MTVGGGWIKCGRERERMWKGGEGVWESVGKGESFEGKGRKYKREKGRVWMRDGQFV